MIDTADLTTEQIDILCEALDDFVAKCHPQKQWRAAEQASAMVEQLEHSLRSESRRENSRPYSAKGG